MIDVFNTHRPLLFGIAYRMLGQVGEAEDVVQDVWLRWQKQDAAAIQSAKAWLVSATTRRCIDQLRSARRQREDYYGVWLPEPLTPATETDPAQTAELADSLSMAFMLMLEALGPAERAVFLLREVFGYDYAETAAIVGKSEANCRQIVRRAKEHLQANARPPSPSTDQARRLVEEFLAATGSGDVQHVLSLLTEESTVYSDGGGKVKAAGRAIRGADHVSRFLLGIWPRFMAGVKPSLININGAPGFVVSSGSQVHYALSFQVEGARIQAVFIVCNPDKLRHLATAQSHLPA
ncbi:MAG: polymerase subunit sigma-70 [Rariglobus sp.]|jgi:RNA polymerase sigma-70 factor (ECF subfamily)|nr:polymerase subunit sigma-70 [Rariglobus sp.]